MNERHREVLDYLHS